MSSRPLPIPVARPRFRRWWLAALALTVVATAGIALADRKALSDIGKALTTVRDSSRDAALEAKVRGALALSRRVSPLKIDVDARAGVVMLGGRVPTQEARSIVEAIAADTPGVARVESHIDVDPGATTSGYEQTLLERIADLETEVALQERLRREPLLAGAKLEADVERGVVVLRGWVETDVERAAAQKIAESLAGAEQVRNELETLGPADGPKDRLARRVEFELYATGAFDLSGIKIRSEAGKVHLQGAVRSEAERLLAARLAEAVPGVREVVNELNLAEKAT
jgi:osmotically-inducible protein OsmY